MVRCSLWWLWPWWRAIVAGPSSEEGYLFVSNRPDEVVFAARQIRRVSPQANITFVSDSASLSDVEEELDAFDVVIRSEEAMPDIGRTESMGFRLQKLRGMSLTPYARTVYADSDTFACRPVDELFELLRHVDVACVHGGRGNHSGASAGVLAYANSPAAMALWKAWEREYRNVMAASRREQPSFQRAIASVPTLKVHKLPLFYNCRNVRDCEPAVLKDGTTARCSIIHAHDFSFTKTRSASMNLNVSNDCPALSGGHRLVLLLAPPADRHRRFVLTDSLVQSLQALTLDNDFSLCDLRIGSRLENIQPCLDKSNRYSMVALGSFLPDSLPDSAVAVALARHPLTRLRDALGDDDVAILEACVADDEDGREPSCFQRHANLVDNADTAWFSSGSLNFDDATRTIRTRFLAVGLVEFLLDSLREFERVLPSHFLRLASKLHNPHDRQHDTSLLFSDKVKEAFLAANHLDVKLYEYILQRLMVRRRDCGEQEGEEGTTHGDGDHLRSHHHVGQQNGHHHHHRHHPQRSVSSSR